MEVKILNESCIGCGSCEAISPEVFEINDEGIAEVISDVTDENKDLVIDAAEACPTEAIEINE